MLFGALLEPGLSCCSLLRPNSFFDSTVPVARSFASWASSVSSRFRDVFTALRSRATSLRSVSIVVLSFDSMPASQRSVSRRATSPCKEGTSLAARRASLVSSTASLNLRRQALNRDFHEPASLRDATSAQRSSSARASAASARARPRPFPLIPRPQVARRALRHRHGARPDPAVTLDQRQVGAETFVENRHASDDSAWQSALPVPLRDLNSMGMMIPMSPIPRPDGTLTCSKYRPTCPHLRRVHQRSARRSPGRWRHDRCPRPHRSCGPGPADLRVSVPGRLRCCPASRWETRRTLLPS